MPYARIDENSRIIEWSYDQLDGFVTEFSNGDYVDTTATHGVEDFVIRDGVAYFEPTAEKQQQILKEQLAATATDDLEVAICELAEQQAAYESDVNAALCELYDLIMGGE